jgi:hypothetical protein
MTSFAFLFIIFFGLIAEVQPHYRNDMKQSDNAVKSYGDLVKVIKYLLGGIDWERNCDKIKDMNIQFQTIKANIPPPGSPPGPPPTFPPAGPISIPSGLIGMSSSGSSVSCPVHPVA